MMAPFKRLFGEGFRVFFLAAGLYGVFAVLVWTGWLGIHAAGGTLRAVPFAMAPHLWHAHEMVFGFPAAALGGFFLTAVPNWTGARAVRHLFIATAAGLWLAGRLAIWYSGALAPAVVAAVDLAFLPVLGAKIATQLLRSPKPQNLMFLALLALIWTGNLLVHLEWTGLAADTLDAGLRVGLAGTCAMIAVLGGRVTPAFTRNAMVRSGRENGLPVSRKGVEIVGVASAIILPIAYLAGLADSVIGALALVAGLAQLVRLAGWRPAWTARQPILWSLHIAFALLGLGYLLTGLAAFGVGSAVGALHVLGIGSVGGMTLAVMSRASLGHSGRALVAPVPVAVAYALVPLATGLRWLASEISGAWYWPGVFGSGLLWTLAFALFTAALWPAFWRPRVSGVAAN
ncbi:NnrS family protein [Polymorphum gilvum]|uniref:NnrS family protein n=1 Tax=Polymorphum gilvum (strain LMG 25793 / CGMCC 1.9160 / SL003B-26A1) TaxID=991905 RepID=F2J4R9_POLGS|nr:NnrS family protein [Polymorphum gilvum]ADZ69011.1 NnrS family protein [Polymorphum gilvum SL003B-26A1]